jgi:hypothetical protein
MTNRQEDLNRWKNFRAKRKLAFGLILFHFSAVVFWLLTTNGIADRNLRVEVVSFWGLSIAGITYVLVVASPLLVKKEIRK